MSKKTISDDIKIDECLDLILIFMQRKIEEQGDKIVDIVFYFSPHNGITEDAIDLIELESSLNPKYLKHIQDALNQAKNREYIREYTPYNLKYTKLTEKGSERAILKRDENNNRWKKRYHYFVDKILVPIITSMIISVITCYYLSPK